jgi:hypothetical protein
MSNPFSRGFKLTTVIFVVFIMAITAILSDNNTVDDIDVEITQPEE